MDAIFEDKTVKLRSGGTTPAKTYYRQCNMSNEELWEVIENYFNDTSNEKKK